MKRLLFSALILTLTGLFTISPLLAAKNKSPETKSINNLADKEINAIRSTYNPKIASIKDPKLKKNLMKEKRSKIISIEINREKKIHAIKLKALTDELNRL